MKKVLVVDYGSQYTQLIARRLRELNIYSEVTPWDEISNDDEVAGFILSGGPETSNIKGNPTINQLIFDSKKPILGICYGMQVLAHQEGGKIINDGKKEFGNAKLIIKDWSSLFNNLPNQIDVWMSHGDKVVALPEGYEVIASSDNSPIAAYQNLEKNYFGLQFHPEVTHTNHGLAMIENFIQVCEIQKNWSSEDILEQIEQRVTGDVQEGKVLLALSGGVDSTVLASVLHKQLGKRLVCVMVDHGLLRKDEAQNVRSSLKEKINLDINFCLLYTSPSPRDLSTSRMPSSA